MHDVAVVGLGAMGSATLWQLRRRGVDAIGVDAHDPPHALGSSHGHSRVFRTAYFEHPSYVPLLQRALVLWRELERETGQPLYRETGCLTMGPPDHELIEGVRASVQMHRLPHEELDAVAIRRRFGFRLEPNDVGIYEDEAGLVEPERAIAAMLGDLPRKRMRVTRMEQREDHVVVHGDELLHARRVVACLGAWLPSFGYTAALTAMRQVQHWFRPQRAMDSLPCFIHVAGDHAVYGLPPHGERGIKVCRHYGGELTDPDRLDRALRAEDEADVRAWIRAHLPEADGELDHAVVCMYALTPDRHFVVGPHPEHERILLAGGFSGHGFKMAPVIGEALAELATEGATRHDIALFDPNRFAPT